MIRTSLIIEQKLGNFMNIYAYIFMPYDLCPCSFFTPSSGNIAFYIIATSFPGCSVSFWFGLSQNEKETDDPVGTWLVSLDKANKQQLKFNLDTKSVFCLPQGGCIAFQKANKCDLLFSRSRRSSYYSNKKLKTYAHHMAEKY